MRITNESLLHAMKFADEELVEKTAPRLDDAEDSEEMCTMLSADISRRSSITRRIMEIAALCAAIAFCVLAVYGVSRLRGGRIPPDSPAQTAEKMEAAARDTLERYLDALMDGDRKKALSLSALEMDFRMRDTSDTLDEFITGWKDVIRKYVIGEKAEDYMKECRETVKALKDIADYYYLKFKKEGKLEEAEQYSPEKDEVLQFMLSVRAGYVFHVTLFQTEGEPQTAPMYVLFSDGKWIVQPEEMMTPALSEKAQEELPKLREEFGIEPEEYKPESKPLDRQTEKDVLAFAQAYIDAWDREDFDKVLSMSLFEQNERMRYGAEGEFDREACISRLAKNAAEIKEIDPDAYQKFEFETPEDISDELPYDIQCIEDYRDYTYLSRLEAGRKEQAEKYRDMYNKMLDYAKSIEMFVRIPCEDMLSFEMVRINGEWKIQPDEHAIPRSAPSYFDDNPEKTQRTLKMLRTEYADSIQNTDSEAARDALKVWLDAILENSSDIDLYSYAGAIADIRDLEWKPEKFFPAVQEKGYQIGDMRDATDLLKEWAELEAERTDYDCLSMLRNGESPEYVDSERVNHQSIIDYYRNCTKYLLFTVSFEDAAGKQQTKEIGAAYCGFKWLALPLDTDLEPLTDEERARYARLKAEYEEDPESFAITVTPVKCPISDFYEDEIRFIHSSYAGKALEGSKDAAEHLVDDLIWSEWGKYNKFDAENILEQNGSLCVWNCGDPYMLTVVRDGVILYKHGSEKTLYAVNSGITDSLVRLAATSEYTNSEIDSHFIDLGITDFTPENVWSDKNNTETACGAYEMRRRLLCYLK